MNEPQTHELTQLFGESIIAGEFQSSGNRSFVAVNPANSQELAGRFSCASKTEVDLAMEAATEAAPVYKAISPDRKAEFLEAIADEIVNLGDELIERTMLESALPKGRVVGERGRTCNQLRMFASTAREKWLRRRGLNPGLLGEGQVS